MTELDNQKQNALIYAVRHDRFQIVKELVKVSNINHKDSAGCTALHYAADGGYAKTVEILLTNGANSQLTNSENKTPYHLACNRRHRNCQNLLQN